MASPDLTEAMQDLTHLGAVGVLAILLGASLLAFWATDHLGSAALLARSMASAIVLENAAKFAFQRQRPEPFFNIVAPETFSFPSGHSFFSACFYGCLALLVTSQAANPIVRSMIWILATAIIGAIGFSRIYLGVHYPTDVVAGYLAAAFCLSAVCGRGVTPR
jgi:undecaprenyl-diphosphatase